MEEKTMASWPRTTVDTYEYEGREWIHPRIPSYYLHRFPKDLDSGDLAGKWVVINRNSDLQDGRGFRSKGACIRDFVRRHDPEWAY
jgi:hypothetical protein